MIEFFLLKWEVSGNSQYTNESSYTLLKPTCYATHSSLEFYKNFYVLDRMQNKNFNKSSNKND